MPPHVASAPTKTRASWPRLLLLELLAAIGDEVEERPDLTVEKVDVGRVGAARGGVASNTVRVDRYHPDVADVARCLFRLPLRIQEVLHAVQDDRLSLDRAQRLPIVAVMSRGRAHIVPLVRPRLVDPVVRIEGFHETPFLLGQPRQDVKRPLELVPPHFRRARREEKDVAPQADAFLWRTRVVAVAP